MTGGKCLPFLFAQGYRTMTVFCSKSNLLQKASTRLNGIGMRENNSEVVHLNWKNLSCAYWSRVLFFPKGDKYQTKSLNVKICISKLV